MSESTLISLCSILVACLSALYARWQAKSAKDSAIKSEESVKQALEQNRNSALIILKEHYERELPRIKASADHFATPETMNESKMLTDEYMETRNKLHAVNDEIRKLYDHYILEGKSS